MEAEEEELATEPHIEKCFDDFTPEEDDDEEEVSDEDSQDSQDSNDSQGDEEDELEIEEDSTPIRKPAIKARDIAQISQLLDKLMNKRQQRKEKEMKETIPESDTTSSKPQKSPLSIIADIRKSLMSDKRTPLYHNPIDILGFDQVLGAAAGKNR